MICSWQQLIPQETGHKDVSKAHSSGAGRAWVISRDPAKANLLSVMVGTMCKNGVKKCSVEWGEARERRRQQQRMFINNEMLKYKEIFQ